ncbi:saccharopine dehydrogenase-like oxidoreductase [Zootermopsis nevadensis]|uniref:Putative saccharopine dehydrogenase n=1 Tax=Zootermopsis nevadensis TaxID=136037 RepID=A0A067QRX6_ZOONE|nr:saccharopine dehydrogenase-like oxidoreductase [Zootermopsis nevadensis]XP_021932605.1 saccharopine dehydrogenase-like oxidoreductase [Zootermopsis nevadensis]KDR12595.1 putative saccharopine dehydrogenase [Zootermopsis nevadensis]
MASQGDKVDIIVFGATGFTGKVAVYKILNLAKEKGITWGISGRNKDKLNDVLKEVAEKTGEDLAAVKVVEADVKDASSLQQMASQARVLVNCVGPYRFYGEAVVSACIASGTHHVDVSGEPQYMEKIQLEYHKAAEEKGVYIVSACGFDSIPADLGTVFLMNKFQGDLNSVETYLESGTTEPVQGAFVHYGTWESMVYGLAHYNELRPLRQKLFPDRLPQFTPKLKRRLLFKNKEFDGWCVPFPGSDRSVMLRSQRYFFEHEKLRPVQVQTYLLIKSVFSVFALGILGLIFVVLSKFQCGRNLLLKYPQLFSGGAISHEGPSVENMKKSYINLMLFGEGWAEKLAEPTDQHDLPPNKHVTVKISGEDPFYGLTSLILLLSAVTILRESDKMPGRGGVYPPGAAFAKTTLIEELDKHGLKFEILPSEGD